MSLAEIKRQENQELFNEYVENWAKIRNESIEEVLQLKLVQEYSRELGVFYTGGLNG